MKGRLFGVGVGPGDPELMTYKAVRTIEKCPVIAVPAKGREHAVSYRIAAGMVDNMEEKEYLDLDTPCLLYTSPSPRDGLLSRMPSSA